MSHNNVLYVFADKMSKHEYGNFLENLSFMQIYVFECVVDTRNGQLFDI